MLLPSTCRQKLLQPTNTDTTQLHKTNKTTNPCSVLGCHNWGRTAPTWHSEWATISAQRFKEGVKVVLIVLRTSAFINAENGSSLVSRGKHLLLAPLTFYSPLDVHFQSPSRAIASTRGNHCMFSTFQSLKHTYSSTWHSVSTVAWVGTHSL